MVRKEDIRPEDVGGMRQATQGILGSPVGATRTPLPSRGLASSDPVVVDIAVLKTAPVLSEKFSEQDKLSVEFRSKLEKEIYPSMKASMGTVSGQDTFIAWVVLVLLIPDRDKTPVKPDVVEWQEVPKIH